MAYDKPLKTQWTEINGRAVPLVLPQYWSDEQNDWVVSSEQNRLPVDAQLTGSIVLLQRALNETVSAGSKSYLINMNDTDILHDFTDILVAVGSSVEESVHDYDVALSFHVSEAEVGQGALVYEQFKEKFKDTETRSKALDEPSPILGDTVRVRIFNNDDEDHNYDVHLWGVKK